MSTLIETYESEFQTTFDRAKSLLSSATHSTTGNNNALLKQIEGFKDDLMDLIQQMELEVNSPNAPPQWKIQMKTKLRNYKQQVSNEIQAPLNEMVSNDKRQQLFGAASGAGADGEYTGDSVSDAQRQQLLGTHQQLQNSSNKLRDATRVANETENIGSQIMMDLRSQRETLENARQTLFQADSYVDKSIKTLKVMGRRLIANKFISYAIIAILILLILLVLYSKF
ncbi:hypothetical protein ACO0QE_003718 [Hanseniaspora vineae]